MIEEKWVAMSFESFEIVTFLVGKLISYTYFVNSSFYRTFLKLINYTSPIQSQNIRNKKQIYFVENWNMRLIIYLDVTMFFYIIYLIYPKINQFSIKNNSRYLYRTIIKRSLIFYCKVITVLEVFALLVINI